MIASVWNDLGALFVTVSLVGFVLAILYGSESDPRDFDGPPGDD